MSDIKKISKEETWPIRHKVMWPDRNIEYIKLDDDDQGIHYGLYIDGRLVSVVSLFIEGDKAQFRKFATLEEEQGKGYGSRLLNHMLQEAKKLGVKLVWCNARKNKADYYKRFGLEETDQVFEKGGMEYVVMEKGL